MLETVKYIDQESLVIIYKNFTQLPTEDRIKIAENISSVENALVLKAEKVNESKPAVVSLSGKVIKTLPELRAEMELSENQRDMDAIKGFLENFVKTVNIDVFKKYSKGQNKSFLDIFREICPKSFFDILDKAYVEDSFDKVVALITYLKETINTQK